MAHVSLGLQVDTVWQVLGRVVSHNIMQTIQVDCEVDYLWACSSHWLTVSVLQQHFYTAYGYIHNALVCLCVERRIMPLFTTSTKDPCFTSYLTRMKQRLWLLAVQSSNCGRRSMYQWYQYIHVQYCVELESLK